MRRVPTTREVLPGASVNIVLKADQPTGRTVSGVVQDVLTRGNHPRGIKVRLADGRVGRVQTMVTGAATSGQAAESGETSGDVFRQDGFSHQLHQSGRQGQGQDELPSSTVGLDAYIKPARQRKPAKKQDQSSTDAQSQHFAQEQSALVPEETSTCPVCGAFEGDVAAVAHHVASHFDD
ncbi:hypothetical protein OQA88_12458 [Cercophora sp. LCS_1]